MKKELKVILGLLIILLIALIFGLYNKVKNSIKLETKDIKKIVLKEMNQNASNVHFRKVEMEFEDGKYIYEIEAIANNNVYEYEVDAKTGVILKRKSETNNEKEQFISKEEAKTIALKDLNLEVSSNITFLKEKQEKNAYEIEFLYEGKKYEYEIEASIGTILKKEVEPVKSDVGNTDVSIEQAKIIILKHAHLENVSNITFTKEKLELETGKQVYEIEFLYDGTKYEYEVDAKTGMILEFETEKK